MHSVRSLRTDISAVATLVAVLLFCICASAAADPWYRSESLKSTATSRRVLILNSYHSGMPFSDEEVNGIRENLPHDAEIFIEYMDAKRRHDASYMSLLARTYQLKYTDQQFDVILSLDDDALRFLLVHGDSIFPGIPIIFCGVNNFRPEDISGRKRFTGVIQTMDIEPTLQIGLQLYPSARQILVVTDRSTTGLSNRAVLERIAASGDLGVPMRFLDEGDGLDLPGLLARLKAEKTPSLIYFADFFLDKNGHTLNIETVMPQVANTAPGPVLVHSGMYMDLGALGGKINSGYSQGSMAARIAARVWNGESPADIPVEYKDINRVILDYRVLEHWGIDVSALPESVQYEIVNQPEDLFQGYGLYLLAALVFIVVESALILLLLKLLRQQRQLREEGKQREALLGSILESAPVPLSYALESGEILDMNSAMTNALGYTIEDVPTFERWWPTVYPDPEYRRQTLERWDKDVRTGTKRLEEFRLTAKDGSEHDMLISTTRQGKYIIASFFDITERKNQEELLRQSEEKFSRIFQMAPEGIAFMRLSDSTVIDVNSAFERIIGYPPSELIGGPAGKLHAWNRTEDALEYMRRLTETGMVQDFEFGFRHRDGGLRTGLISAQTVSMAGEDCAISVTHDITNTRKMQEMMIQTEKMISVGGIAAGIAHEINNPLGIILQSAQTLAQRMDTSFPRNMRVAEEVGLDLARLDAYARERKLNVFVSDIQSAAVRAAAIIRHMLDFSRRSESRRTLCSIETIIERALTLASNDFDLKKSFDFKRITVSKSYAPDIPSVNCTETEIEQVLLNLLRNSAQAIGSRPEGEPRISIRTWLDGGMAYIEVRDNGPGIPLDIQKRIFEPFYTTKGPGVGTGLGLSVSYFIVTKGHDGTMTVSSEPGQGCAFTIGLPLGIPAKTEEKDEKTAPRAAY